MAFLEWMLQADTFQLLLVFVAVLLVIVFTRRFLEDLKAPPGPWGLPIVGYEPFVNVNALPQHLKKLSEKYGPVFSMRLGNRMAIVLSDYETVKETFIRQNEIYSGRVDGFFSVNWMGNYCSVIATDGDIWKEQRRFLLSTLRDFGFAKLSLESVIHEEAEALKTFLSETDGKAIDVSLLMNKVSANIICHLLFGQRFEYDHEKLQKLLEINDESMRSFRFIQYADTLPLVRYLPKSWTGYDKLVKTKSKFYAFIDDRIKEHEETFDPNNIRDLVDVYLLKEQESKTSNADNNKGSIYTRRHLRANCVLLFGAGLDTTAVTLTWAFKIMFSYPEIQKKIQEEINNVVGRSRLPSWTDKPNLAYTEATLQEVLRYSSLLPINVPHANMEETELHGYTIPKKSTIFVNLWQIHNDPKYWKNPEEFNPSRFLDKSGKVIKREELVAFSVGGRVCLGESLARMEILLFLATVLQNFNILPSAGENTTFSTAQSAMRKLALFKLRFVLRS